METILNATPEMALNTSSNNNYVPKKPPRRESAEYVEDESDNTNPDVHKEDIHRHFREGTETETPTPNDECSLDRTVITDSTSASTGNVKESVGIMNTTTRPPTPTDMRERKQAVERSITWLRQELMDMRKTDQTLIMQLMNIQMKIHSLKTEVLPNSPLLVHKSHDLRPDYQRHSRKPSEEFYLDNVWEEDELEDNEVLEDDMEVDVEEENGEPVAWREFQRRLSCRRTFSKRGKMPGIVRETAATS